MGYKGGIDTSFNGLARAVARSFSGKVFVALLHVCVVLCACQRPAAAPPREPAHPTPITAFAKSPPPSAGRAAPKPHPPPELPRKPARPAKRSTEGEALAVRFGGQPAKARFVGKASYYSDALAGRTTASGEAYDPKAFTAAHRTLPFGSVLRVVREDSKKMVYVRINDRGPFVRGRVVDLSRAAAEAIEMIRRGVVRVRVEVVLRGPEPQKRKQPTRRKTKRKKRASAPVGAKTC